MKKIFFFDIDNTLLDHASQRIPDSALEAIAKLKVAGHTIAIATGRGYDHAREFVAQVQPDYAITQNGARVLRGEEVVSKKALDPVAMRRLFQLMLAKGFQYGVNNGHVGRVSADVPDVSRPLESVAIAVQTDPEFYQGQDVFQGWMFFHERHDSVLIPELLQAFPEFDYVRWHPTAVDVLPKGINKMVGCHWVLADAGFDATQAYAFGDGLNDMEMLQGVGTGIAMGNAHPQLIAVADRVAPAVHDDGVARMLAQIQEELNA